MGTTAEKLAKLEATKAGIKTAINDPALGDKFADYPGAITTGKSAIASAITAKGVQTVANATFAQMAANISTIKQGAKIVQLEIQFNSGDGVPTVISQYDNIFSYSPNQSYIDVDLGGLVYIICNNLQNLVDCEEIAINYQGYDDGNIVGKSKIIKITGENPHIDVFF